MFARDNYRCQYCHAAAENIDHVIPRSRGGTHTWDNVVAACRACNARKEDRLLHEINMRLRRPPTTPHDRAWVIAATGSRRPDWEQWLRVPSHARGDGVGLTTRLTHWAGRAGALHGRPISDAHVITQLHATRPAIVLGRAQKVDDGFDARAGAAGFEVARRVSGGSAVVVGPGECVWVDVVVARDAPGWNDDIGKAGCWMGDQWVAALGGGRRRGPEGPPHGACNAAPGYDAVCFAGVGSGEVLRGRRRQTRRHLAAPHPGLGAVPVRHPAALGPVGADRGARPAGRAGTGRRRRYA